MCCELYMEYMAEKANNATPGPFNQPTPLLRRLLGLKDDLQETDGSEKTAVEDESSAECEVGRERVLGVLERLRKADAHLSIHDDAGLWADGVWIIKPCGGSCGRDIRVVAFLPELLGELAARKYDCVVQKYIDRPLLLAGTLMHHRLPALVLRFVYSQCALIMSIEVI